MPKLKRRVLTPRPTGSEILWAMELLKLAGVQQTTDSILIAVEEMRKDQAAVPFARVPTEESIRKRIAEDKDKEKTDGTV